MITVLFAIATAQILPRSAAEFAAFDKGNDPFKSWRRVRLEFQGVNRNGGASIVQYRVYSAIAASSSLMEFLHRAAALGYKGYSATMRGRKEAPRFFRRRYDYATNPNDWDVVWTPGKYLGHGIVEDRFDDPSSSYIGVVSHGIPRPGSRSGGVIRRHFGVRQ